MCTGKWTTSSRLTSRRRLRTFSGRSSTSAATSNWCWAVTYAESAFSPTATPPILHPMLAAWPRLRLYPLVALLALAFGFFFAAQLRAELIPPSNRVARNEALALTVRSLETDNAAYRSRTAALQSQIGRLETDAALRSGASRQLADQVAELRAHSGLTRLHGPGETVTLGNGQSPKGGAAVSAYLVNFQDVQDVVNLLFRGGAEGIAVNGRRITPESRIVGAGTAVVIDDGPPLVPPFTARMPTSPGRRTPSLRGATCSAAPAARRSPTPRSAPRRSTSGSCRAWTRFGGQASWSPSTLRSTTWTSRTRSTTSTSPAPKRSPWPGDGSSRAL